MKYYFIIVLSFFVIVHTELTAQISQGGMPREVVALKSTSLSVFNLPKLDNQELLKASMDEFETEGSLKPFRFAHPFHVDLNTTNSGIWSESEDGYKIWKIRIKSEGAFSINLILKPYYLPPGAKLYIYNPDKSKVLGAFTETNNKRFKSLAVSPLGGDEIIVQYEEPKNAKFEGELGIKTINHDFFGVAEFSNERRPFYPEEQSGSCNIDINCDIAKKWQIIKNSICRIYIDGNELCSGVLVNNTKQDQTPYVLSANHCFKDHINGEQNSVFLFNYQSPYCGALDGDIATSISGSELKAKFDSLDFNLVELTVVPPPEFRPYYAGWDHTDYYPDTVVCIHHPWGEVKKIAFDNNSPVKSSYKVSYIAKGFWKTLEWDYGTTELGSSGGPYIDQNKHVIGNLTGGDADCDDPVNDYFSRFALAWDYKSESNKQLKHWLDPDNSSDGYIDGFAPYSGEDYCDAFTNLVDGDEHQVIKLIEQGNVFAGYWGGTNNAGISEITERFSIAGDEILHGVSFGVAKMTKNSFGSSYITLKVYNGNDEPESLIYSKNVNINTFVPDAMNFVSFDALVEPDEIFYVGFDVSNIQPQDTFAVYQAVRSSGENSFYLKQDGVWYDFTQKNLSGNNSSLAFEVIACNVTAQLNDTTIDEIPEEINIYPNPVSTYFNLLVPNSIFESEIRVFNLLGKEIPVVVKQKGEYKFRIYLPTAFPGVYFVRINSKDLTASKKFTYLPY